MKAQQNRRGALRRKSIAIAVAGLLVGGAGATVGAASASAGVRPQGIISTAQAEVFVSVSPTRILDTRGAPTYTPVGVPVAKKLGQGESLDLKIAGGQSGLVPVGATAAVLNTTIDYDATKTSFITVYPKGEERPSASTNNPVPGMVTANATIAKLGQDGSVTVYNLYGQTNVVFDLVGYLIPLNQVTGFEGTGTTGGTVHSGEGAPTSGTAGVDGDYYIDTATNQLYGPKASGAYPALPTTLTASALGTFNDSTVTLALGPSSIAFPVTNDTRPGPAGTNQGAILHNTATPAQFTLAGGTYKVDYRLTASAGILDAVQLQLNGTPVGASNTVAGLAGVTLTDAVLVKVPAGGGVLTLSANTGPIIVTVASSSIVIQQIG